MTEGEHHRQPISRETAEERAEFAAMEARRYPPFDRRRFLTFFGLGLVSFCYGTWSLSTYDYKHGNFPEVQAWAFGSGVFFIVMAFVGRQLQKLEQARAKP